jgi:two-component system OmpR family sensor kinase
MNRVRLAAPHSLRARLTVWHAVVLALALIAFTVAVYILLAHNLNQEIDQSLAERVEQLNHAIPPNLPFSRLESLSIPPPDAFASADTFVRVLTREGEVLGTSENLRGVQLPILEEELMAVGAGGERYRLANLAGERVRLYSAPLFFQGQPVGVIQVARGLHHVNSALMWFRVLAGSGLLLTFGLSGVVVWLATGRALRPLERVIQTAETIGASADLSPRVASPSAADEVGRLASTFNQMLDRLEASAADLRAAYAQVERALEAQRRFIADASHELRTPLTTIRGNASLLCQFPEVTAEDRAAALAQIRQEADRMSRLVQQLLFLARADAGQQLPQVPVALGPLVEEVSAQARVLARGQQLWMQINQPAEVSGDPDALRQLVWILLDNAIKYTPSSGRINVQVTSNEGPVRLRVADTGIGISEEDLPHIFERFYRADRGRKAGGTGLGLAIARSIVEQHGGTIQVESAPGQGSTFLVQLPQAKGNATSALDTSSFGAP